MQTPSPGALAAKDAGVELLPLLGQREREQLGSELLTWVVEDLDQRADQVGGSDIAPQGQDAPAKDPSP